MVTLAIWSAAALSHTHYYHLYRIYGLIWLYGQFFCWSHCGPYIRYLLYVHIQNELSVIVSNFALRHSEGIQSRSQITSGNNAKSVTKWTAAQGSHAFIQQSVPIRFMHLRTTRSSFICGFKPSGADAAAEQICQTTPPAPNERASELATHTVSYLRQHAWFAHSGGNCRSVCLSLLFSDPYFAVSHSGTKFFLNMTLITDNRESLTQWAFY